MFSMYKFQCQSTYIILIPHLCTPRRRLLPDHWWFFQMDTVYKISVHSDLDTEILGMVGKTLAPHCKNYPLDKELQVRNMNLAILSSK